MRNPLVQLGALVEIINGGAWKQTEYAEEGIPVVQVSNLKNGMIDTNDLKFLPLVSYERYKKHVLKENDLIIATVGSHATEVSAAGRATIAKENVSGMLLNQNAVLIRSKSELLDQSYLGLLGRSDGFQSYLRMAGRGAANQVRIALSAIREFEFLLPTLAVQQEIASIFSAYDDLIENNTRRIELLEQSAQELYKEWFIRLKFPGHEHAKMIDGVPENWQRVTLGEVCYLRNERVNPVDVEQDTPYVGLEHIPRESITLRSWGASETVTSTKLRFEKRDVLFGKIRPYFHKVVFAPIDGICSSDTLIINTENPDLYLYLLATVSSVQFVKYTSTTVKEGSKMPRADWDMMMRYPLHLPPKTLLSGFNTFMQAVVGQLENLMFQNQKLQQARDLLLPKLMTGEIVV